ncbi:hypothetical protein DFP95_107117 [Cohnella lupini]|uniref:Uncharacterized protein n=1 Tax=Cohnella lupini TaxID=1294267 RepID=A0A3D9IBX7_9BACL|nr:hypothetical protein DFP95_107117 [Cohnella lupini]
MRFQDHEFNTCFRVLASASSLEFLVIQVDQDCDNVARDRVDLRLARLCRGVQEVCASHSRKSRLSRGFPAVRSPHSRLNRLSRGFPDVRSSHSRINRLWRGIPKVRSPHSRINRLSHGIPQVRSSHSRNNRLWRSILRWMSLDRLFGIYFLICKKGPHRGPFTAFRAPIRLPVKHPALEPSQ